jgi:predicted CoA-binding protein
VSAIEDFLGLKRIAVIGVSQRSNDFSRMLFGEMLKRGYDVVPVNPAATEIEGRACYAHVLDVTPPVEGALLMTAPDVTDRVVRDCLKAGIGKVWMYRATGKGAVSDGAVRFCRENGIEVVPGACPFMFWPNTGFVHRVHGFFVRRFSDRFKATV